MREGKPLPQKIQNAPSVRFGMQFYMDAFMDLTSCRQIGQTLGPIPWTAINDYALRLDLSEGEAEDLHYFVQALDNEYVKYETKKAQSKVKSK